jgi:tetratricopeptide (TPR) repeat protein
VDNAQLRRALAQIIVEHASQRLQPAFEPTAALSEVALSSSSAPLISPVPLSVRTWVADYLSSVNDARCIVLYEGLLKDLDSQPQRKAVMSSWSWVHPVGSLAESYAQFLRFEKAAQVWERAPEYSNNPAWLADATLEAARARRRAGQEEKAAKLYAKVPQYGNGWFTGVALYDQAYQLIENGKHTEARALLLQPVTGERAEAVQVGLWTLAAYSFFSTGDFVSSTQFSKAALNQFKTLKDPSKHMGIDLQVKIAQNTLLWSKRWKEQPFTCEPKEIRAVLQRGENQPSWRITVRSFSAIPLSVQVTDARLKAQVSPSSSPVVLGKRYYFEQEVIVEAVPELIEKALTATMTISSPATPNFQAHVLVSLDVKEQ